MSHIVRLVASQDDAEDVFTCDVGLPTVWAARFLAVNGKRGLVCSFWHASMAIATAQAIGAPAAFPQKFMSTWVNGVLSPLTTQLLGAKDVSTAIAW